MKTLVAWVLMLAASQALAGDADVIEAGKRKAVREFGELRAPEFRKLRVIRAADGKPIWVCGEISAKNRPKFTKFYVYLDEQPGVYQRGIDNQVMDELVDAVCNTGR